MDGAGPLSQTVNPPPHIRDLLSLPPSTDFSSADGTPRHASTA